MKSYLLDTSVIIDYLRGKSEVIGLINQLDGRITSSYFCLAELMEGAARSNQPTKVKKIILGLFSGFNEVYGLEESVAERFGSLRKDLKQNGKVCADIDIFLAATCLVHDLVLVTQNKKHFRPVRDLILA